MLTVGGLAEFERELIRIRTGEGRPRAKANEQSLGRKPKLTPPLGRAGAPGYNTNTYSSFETGLIMVEGALIGTTEYDIFSIDRRPVPRIGARMRTSRRTFCR